MPTLILSFFAALRHDFYSLARPWRIDACEFERGLALLEIGIRRDWSECLGEGKYSVSLGCCRLRIDSVDPYLDTRGLMKHEGQALR